MSCKSADPPLNGPLPFLIQVLAGFLRRKCMNPPGNIAFAVLMDFDKCLVFLSQAWRFWYTRSREQMQEPRNQRA